jgi:hypothetical protein
VQGDTAWLTQAEFANLFESTRKNVSPRSRNTLREGKLPEESVKESLTIECTGILLAQHQRQGEGLRHRLKGERHATVARLVPFAVERRYCDPNMRRIRVGSSGM